MDQHQRNRQVSSRIMSSEANKRVIEQHPASPAHLPSATTDLLDTPNTTISAIMGPSLDLEQENATYAATYKLHAEAQARMREREQEMFNKLKQQKDKATKSPFDFKKAFKTLTPNRKRSKSTTELNTHGMHDGKHKAEPEYDFNQHRRDYMTRHRPVTPSPAAMPPQIRSGTHTASMPPSNARLLDEIDTPIHTTAPASQRPVPSLTPRLMQQPLSSHTVRDSYSIALGRPITDTESQQTTPIHLTPTNKKSYSTTSRSHLVSRPSIRSHHAEVENSIHDPTSQLARSIFAGQPIVKLAADEELEDASIDVVASNLNQNQSTMSDAYVVAAFDGVHLHTEDVKKEVMARMDALEEKMDRVLALLSAPGAATGQERELQQHGLRDQRAGERGVEREGGMHSKRAGLPPRASSGGEMEGWFDAVKE